MRERARKLALRVGLAQELQRLCLCCCGIGGGFLKGIGVCIGVKECGGCLREKKELHLCWIASLKVRKLMVEGLWERGGWRGRERDGGSGSCGGGDMYIWCCYT